MKAPSQLDLWNNRKDFPWDDFKVAREYVRSLRLADQTAWESYVNDRKLRDTKIPEDPDRIYLNRGWKSWNDWLGIADPEKAGERQRTGLFNDPEDNLWSQEESSKWMNFHEARRIARDYGFEYKEEWELFVEGKFPGREPLPENMPGNPDRIYRFVGWKSWKDWLVNPEKQIEYADYYRAREFVRSCRIPDKDNWRGFIEDNSRITGEYNLVLPLRPHLEYADSGWIDWEDWLGTDIGYRDFMSTRKFVHSLKLRNKTEWFDFCRGRLIHKPRKAKNIYTYPDLAFKDDGWKGWGDWLGTGNTGKDWQGTLKAGEDAQGQGQASAHAADSAQTSSPSHTSPENREIIIDCKCKGRIKDCPHCDGKGYYTVNYT